MDELKSRTGAQTVSMGGTRVLYPPMPASYTAYRAMRRHPTIALARALTIAPVVAAEWGIEADDEVDDERVKFIQDNLFPVREVLVQSAMEGGVDFGWAPFEKVFVKDENGQVVLKKMKPLLHDITDILVDPVTGSFQGFEQNSNVLELQYSLLVPFRVEGTYWYGEALLENARDPWLKWRAASEGAERYDAKIAGSHWKIVYPRGSTEIDGVETDNAEIAKQLLSTLEASGSVTVPRTVSEFVDELETGRESLGWEIEIMGDSSARQYSFVARLQYLDKQMVRAMLVPERAILEGQFGTKAESRTHQNLALIHMDLQHRYVTRLVNWHVVNQLLRLNYGPNADNTVRLVPSPLADEAIEWLRTVYEKALANPLAAAEELADIDMDAMKDILSVPKSQEVTSGEEEEEEVDVDVLEEVTPGVEE